MTQILRWEAPGRRRRMHDSLAIEEPLEIRVDSRPLTVTMRTPGHDADLAAGFLLGEGLIRTAADVLALRPSPRNRSGNVIDVGLAPSITVDWASLSRHVVTSSSCGLCGASSIRAIRRRFPPIRGGISVSAGTLLSLPDRMREKQESFEVTGGLHAAALFDAAGTLQVIREDIGRHNAVDKVTGWALRNGQLPLVDRVLLVSGRTSFEILQKALAAGIPVIASVSAPSSLATEFARRNGQTLVGFLRDGRFNVYAGRRRIRFPKQP